jgi:hypothetical protein
LAKAKKLPVDFLRAQGLRDELSGICIAYRNEDGTPAKRHHMRKRLEHVKGWSWWTGSKGDGEIVPYGLWRLAGARKAGYLVLAEGESDPWTLWHHGFEALGVPGAEMTKVLRSEHFQGIPKVYISQDGDTSGSKFVQDVLKRLEEFRWGGTAFVVLPYGYKDLSEFHCANPEKFKEWFSKALETAAEVANWGKRAKERDISSVWQQAVYVSHEEESVATNYLEEPILQPGHLTEIAGPRGLGKSNYARWLACKLARAGKRVLYLDRDNPPRKARQAIRDWGGAGIVKLLARDKVPALLGSGHAWGDFPVTDYDVVVLDSWDSSAEGSGEKDSRLPSLAMSHVLDIAHAENGPGFLVLMNTVRDGTHSRCNGTVEDRADAVFDVRDITSISFTGQKPWWEEIPLVAAKDWAVRSTRRQQREKFRMAFVASKFKHDGAEPEPFAIEIDFTASPFSIRSVTDEIDREGAEAREQRVRERTEAIGKAADALAGEILRRDSSGEPPMLKDEAISFLMAEPHKLTRSPAREAVNRPDHRWGLAKLTGKKGRPIALIPSSKNKTSGGNNPVTEGAKIQDENEVHFRRVHEQRAAEIHPSQTRVNSGSSEAGISADSLLFTPAGSAQNGADEAAGGDEETVRL